jgi:uncharacterized protein (DUF58 family)
VESSSPFGLVNTRRKLRAESDLVVYPLYFELMGAMFPFNKTFSGMTAAPGSRPGEGPSFFGLREYRIGDPIRKIHWPTTVRTRTVMVKEFEEDMHSSVTLLLDTSQGSLFKTGNTSNLEHAIRTAASLANYTLVNGHPTTLMYCEDDSYAFCMDKATGNLTPVLDALARLEPANITPAELLASARRRLNKNANCMVVLLSHNRAAMEELLKLRSMGADVFLVVVDRYGHRAVEKHSDWLPEMLQLFEYAGINSIMMTPDDDIQATLSRNLRPAKRVRYTACS